MDRLDWAHIDAVTLDAYGTLLRLADPIPALREALRARGAERTDEEVAAAFRTEGEYYRTHVARGRDVESLAQLRAECAAVFSEAVGVELDAGTYVGCLEFELLNGVREAVEALRARGLELAVVGNWDVSLLERLDEAGLHFDVVVPAAAKPDPAGLLLALERLGVRPDRALHVGDEPADEEAARAAGMRFAWAPLENVLT